MNLPSPYDPKPDAELLAALKRCVDQLSGKRPRKTNNRRAKLDFDLELAIAEAGKAIANAEGRANGDPITGEVSIDGDPDMVEIDGEAIG